VSFVDGADATRRAIGAAYYHPLAVRRFASTIKRLQRTVGLASNLAVPPLLIRSPVRFKSDVEKVS
jgi:hypothetical protein